MSKPGKLSPIFPYNHLDSMKAENQRNQLRSLRKYGAPSENIEELVTLQGGVCKICGISVRGSLYNKPVIDHDHKTGKFRGILCNRCNSGIGMLKDDANITYAAACYLRDSKNSKFHGRRS